MARFENNRGDVQSIVNMIKNQPMKFDRSNFNLSASHYGIGTFYQIMPLDWLRILPGDNININPQLIIEQITPLVKKLKTNWRCYVQYYKQYDFDIFEDSELYYYGGPDGDIKIKKPVVDWEYPTTYSEGGESITLKQHTDLPCTPADYMGYPIGSKNFDSNAPTMADIFKFGYHFDSEFTPYGVLSYAHRKQLSVDDEFDACPLVCYQNIIRDCFDERNLLYKNKALFPDNPHHKLIPSGTEKVCTVQYYYPDDRGPYIDISAFEHDTYRQYCLSSPTHDLKDGKPIGGRPINAMGWHNRRGDKFVSASPFSDLIRGTVPMIDLASLFAQGFQVDSSDVVGTNSDMGAYNVLAHTGNDLVAATSHNGNTYSSEGTAILKNALQKLKVISASEPTGITANAIRGLLAYTVYAERRAKTDGTYNSYIISQFGLSPKHHDYTPEYIGGFYFDILGNEVTQSTPTESSPLGSKAQSFFGGGQGNIHTFSNDYGWIIGVVFILPDEVYRDGADLNLLTVDSEKEYIPIMNNLSPVMIDNRELFFKNPVNPEGETTFAWTERYYQHKSRLSYATSLLACADDSHFTSYTGWIQFHKNNVYQDQPVVDSFNSWFVAGFWDKVDMSVFSDMVDFPFFLQLNSNVSMSRIMPYVTNPPTMGISA